MKDVCNSLPNSQENVIVHKICCQSLNHCRKSGAEHQCQSFSDWRHVVAFHNLNMRTSNGIVQHHYRTLFFIIAEMAQTVPPFESAAQNPCQAFYRLRPRPDAGNREGLPIGVTTKILINNKSPSTAKEERNAHLVLFQQVTKTSGGGHNDITATTKYNFSRTPTLLQTNDYNYYCKTEHLTYPRRSVWAWS